MLTLYSLIFACATVHVSYGQTGCSYGIQKEMASCYGSLQGYVQASSPEAKREHCGDARSGLDCIRATVAKCESIDDYLPFQGMLESFDMIEAEMNSICEEPRRESPPEVTEPSNVIATCSKNDKKQLRRCSRKLQRFAAESPIRCQRVRKAMDCMVTLLEQCRSSIRRKTVKKLEKVRRDLMDVCVETNEIDEEDIEEVVTIPAVSEIRTTLRPPPPVRPPVCPPNAFERITECTAPIQSVDPSLGKAVMCSQLNSAVTCLQDIVDRCMAEPGMEAVAGMMEKTRTYVQSQCPETNEVEENRACPADYEDQIMRCGQDAQSLPPGVDMAEQCRVINSALGCFEAIIDMCKGNKDVDAFTTMFNLDYMRSIISDHCSGKEITIPETGGETNENCPADYVQQIQECVQPLQGLAQRQGSVTDAHACGVAEDGLRCLGELLTNCGGKEEVRMMNSMMNMDEMQAAIDSECAGISGNETEVEVGNGDCPADYEAQIQGCARQMQTISPGMDMAGQCAAINSAFECVDTVLDRCKGVPEVDAVTRVMNLDNMKNIVSDHCAGKEITIPETGGQTNENCPDNYQQRIQECVAPMRGMASLQGESGLDQAQACSIASDGLGCLGQLLSDCGGKKEVRLIESTLNMDEMQAMLDSECAPFRGNASGNGKCPPTYAQDIMKCVYPLQNIGELQDIKVICSRMTGALSCVDNFLDICSENPHVQEMPDAVNLDQIRTIVSTTCPTKGYGGEDQGSSMQNDVPDTCAYSDPGSKLLECNSMMNSFSDDSISMEDRCRDVYKALDCSEDLVENCSKNEAIQDFASKANMDQVRQSLKPVCGA